MRREGGSRPSCSYVSFCVSGSTHSELPSQFPIHIFLPTRQCCHVLAELVKQTIFKNVHFYPPPGPRLFLSSSVLSSRFPYPGLLSTQRCFPGSCLYPSFVRLTRQRGCDNRRWEEVYIPHRLILLASATGPTPHLISRRFLPFFLLFILREPRTSSYSLDCLNIPASLSAAGFLLIQPVLFKILGPAPHHYRAQTTRSRGTSLAFIPRSSALQSARVLTYPHRISGVSHHLHLTPPHPPQPHVYPPPPSPQRRSLPAPFSLGHSLGRSKNASSPATPPATQTSRSASSSRSY